MRVPFLCQVVQNWVQHHLAWLETRRMMPLFHASSTGGCLPTLLLFLHLGGHTVDSLAAGEVSSDGLTTTVHATTMFIQSAAAVERSWLLGKNRSGSSTRHMHDTRAHQARGHALGTSSPQQAAKQAAPPPASSPSPPLPRWVTVGSGMLRCTFICTTIGLENAAMLNNILRSAGRGRAAIATTAPPPRRDVASSGYVAVDHDRSSMLSMEPAAAEDGLDELLYVTLIKAAPAELTTTRWFGEWILPRSVAILQDETGLPVRSLTRLDETGLPVRSLRHATASPSTSITASSTESMPTRASTSVWTRLHEALRADGQPGGTWAAATHGTYQGMQLGRRYWSIPDFNPPPPPRPPPAAAAARKAPLWVHVASHEPQGTSLHLSLYPSTNGGLPFPFGYGAYADECRLVVHKLARESTKALTNARCCAPFGGKPRPELLRHAVALLGTNDTHAMTRACHGVLFASWRVTGEHLPRTTTPMLEGRLG